MPAHVKADRLCFTCRVRKPRTAFASSAARRCLGCWQAAARASVCRSCGEQAPLSVEGQPRAYCDDPICQTAKLDAARAVHLAALAARPQPAELRCVACAVTKPVAEFPVARRNDDGSVRRYDPYCRLCRAVYQRLRYHAEPAVREEALEKARLQRAEINRRRAEDPEFDREYRTHIRERERIYRKTVRNRRRPSPSRGRPLFDTEQLPSGPLAEWIYAAANGDQNQLELVCEHAGIHPRTALYWRSGGRHLVPLWQADKALIGLNLLWWEVWNEQTVRRPLLTVTLRKRRTRFLPSGNESVHIEYGERYYGDAGPDHERLAEIEALWVGSPMELAA